jgi:hypothetical protein
MKRGLCMEPSLTVEEMGKYNVRDAKRRQVVKSLD